MPHYTAAGRGQSAPPVTRGSIIDDAWRPNAAHHAAKIGDISPPDEESASYERQPNTVIIFADDFSSRFDFAHMPIVEHFMKATDAVTYGITWRAPRLFRRAGREGSAGHTILAISDYFPGGRPTIYC